MIHVTATSRGCWIGSEFDLNWKRETHYRLLINYDSIEGTYATWSSDQYSFTLTELLSTPMEKCDPTAEMMETLQIHSKRRLECHTLDCKLCCSRRTILASYSTDSVSSSTDSLYQTHIPQTTQAQKAQMTRLKKRADYHP